MDKETLQGHRRMKLLDRLKAYLKRLFQEPEPPPDDEELLLAQLLLDEEADDT
jgi:hypothetical protein